MLNAYTEFMDIKFVKDDNLEENLIELRACKKNIEIENIINSFQEGLSISINLYDGYNVFRMLVKDVFKFYCESGSVLALTKEKVFKVKLKLYQVEERYCSHGFIKINNHEIVNINMIDHFDLSKSGMIYVELIDGNKCKVSRRRVNEIKKYL